jgi:threonine synthase
MVSLDLLAKRWGLRGLWGKAEYLNPTGSYKDRIAAATMAVVLRDGLRGWIGTSSGNGGAAMSAYGARAGLRGVLCVLTDAPREKLASIAPYGVLSLSMNHLGLDVMSLLREIAHDEKLMLTITAHAFNREGMGGADAIGAEIAAHGRATHVYVPTGGGGLLVATARGLRDADYSAAVVAAQPAGCAPIARFLEHEISQPIIIEWTTSISGLQLPAPPDGREAVTAVRTSGGWGSSVPDQAAWDAQDLLARVEGIFVEPAAAVGLAAIRQDVASGRLGREDEPCVILTGSGLKDLERFSLPDRSPQPTNMNRLPAHVRDWMRDGSHETKER